MPDDVADLEPAEDAVVSGDLIEDTQSDRPELTTVLPRMDASR